MSLSLYDVSVGSYLQILQGASGTLEKAAGHFQEAGTDLNSLLDLQLADDMFNLKFQLIAVTHHSKGAIDGLKSGRFQPPDFSQDLDYAGLQGLINEAIASLQGESQADIEALAGGNVIFSLGGNEIPFTVPNFILSFSLPNFYFHTTTAYDILRAQGAPLGKRDFLGPMKVGV